MRARTISKARTERDVGMVQGVCLALAEIACNWGESTLVEEGLASAGIDLSEALACDVDPYDLDALRPALKENERKAKLRDRPRRKR